jgi:polar amino acid transport system permease protein
MTFRYMETLLLAALLYAAICIPATLLVAAIERRLGKHAA